jgi:hypothetical protein
MSGLDPYERGVYIDHIEELARDILQQLSAAFAGVTDQSVRLGLIAATLGTVAQKADGIDTTTDSPPHMLPYPSVTYSLFMVAQHWGGQS